MRRLVISAVILAVVIALAAPADAGDRRHHRHRHHDHPDLRNAALALATFAAANQMLNGPFLYNRRGVDIYAQVYAPPVVYYVQPQVLMPVAPPPVFHPHGRYEFVDGRQWVWIPNAPLPLPCVPTGELVNTPLGYVAVCR